MIEFWDSALVLLLLLGASALGMFMQPFLSERHRSRETVEVIQLVVTMLVTFAALVLGLLTTAAKVSFDTIGNDVRGLATDVIQLDRLLEEYGSGAEAARQTLRIYTAAAIASTWTEEPIPPGTDHPRSLPITATDAPIESTTLGDMLRHVEVQIRALRPPDAEHQRLVSDSLDQFERIAQRRWKLIEEAHSSISMPFYVVLVFWLAIVFASFGLSAPRNMLTFIVILMGGLSIASAVFVLIELDTPFVGLLTVPSQPMRDALAHLSR